MATPFFQDASSDPLSAPVDTGSWWMPIGIRRLRADADVARRREMIASRELDQRGAGLQLDFINSQRRNVADEINAASNRMSARASLMNAQTNQTSVSSQIAEADARLKLEQDKLATYRDLTGEKEKAAMDLAAVFGPSFDQGFNDVITTFQADPALQNEGAVKALHGRSFKAFLDAVGGGVAPDKAANDVLSGLENFIAKKLTYRNQQAFLNTLPPDALGTPLRSVNPLPPPRSLLMPREWQDYWEGIPGGGVGP